MKEYRSVLFPTTQGWGGSKGTANTRELDEMLNAMAKEGWELRFTETLDHTAGSASLLCVFDREARP